MRRRHLRTASALSAGGGGLQSCKATSVPHVGTVLWTGNSLTNIGLQSWNEVAKGLLGKGPCKTRPRWWGRGFFALLLVLRSIPLFAQQQEADAAWAEGRYDAARSNYLQVLAKNPQDVRANLRLGVMLSWQGKLDSALVLLGRARAGDPADVEIRLIEARVLAWDKQYPAALARYDSLLAEYPRLREAALDRARTLAWAGRLDDSRALYRQMIANDSTDRDAMLGAAQVGAWKGELELAEQEYHRLLSRNGRDVDARVGLGYVYLWQGRPGAAGRQADYALTIDSTAKSARDLRHAVREANGSALEGSVNWSDDSDHNTSFWQTLGASAPVGDRLRIFGSVNALQTSDPIRDARRVGAEGGATLSMGKVQLTGAGGARNLTPEVAPTWTAATYRARLSYRPIPRLGLGLGYSRAPFDETALLIEQNLTMESLDGGVDFRPTTTLTVFAGAGALWLSDGNSRTNYSGGATQKFYGHFFLGVLGRTLSYDHRGIGYFSPDRFSVLEGLAGYSRETRRWISGLSGGLGAQQVGSDGSAQTEWHLEGRIGPRWGTGNRIELFGLYTNSAVSSTTGAFRYGSAGVSARLSL
jgi:tetratricopeptide (TPR) repeat protein